MLISLVIKGSDSERECKPLAGDTVPRGEGQGGQARAERQKKGVSNSRISQIGRCSQSGPVQDPLFPLFRVTGEKLKCTKGSRLKHALDIVWDVVLSSGLHTVQGTDSV